MARSIRKKTANLDRKAATKDEQGAKTRRNPKGTSQANPNESARPKRPRVASRPNPNTSARSKQAAQPKPGAKATTKAGPAAARKPRPGPTGQRKPRGGQGRVHKSPFSLFMRELDVLGEITFEYEGQRYVLRLGRGVAALLAVMIVADHDTAAEDADDRGWIHDLNFAARMSALFEVPCDPSDGHPNVMKKHVYKLRRDLAVAVGGAYEGEARAWAHEVVESKPERGYRLNLPNAALRLTVLKPPRRVPGAEG